MNLVTSSITSPFLDTEKLRTALSSPSIPTNKQRNAVAVHRWHHTHRYAGWHCSHASHPPLRNPTTLSCNQTFSSLPLTTTGGAPERPNRCTRRVLSPPPLSKEHDQNCVGRKPARHQTTPKRPWQCVRATVLIGQYKDTRLGKRGVRLRRTESAAPPPPCQCPNHTHHVGVQAAPSPPAQRRPTALAVTHKLCPVQLLLVATLTERLEGALLRSVVPLHASTLPCLTVDRCYDPATWPSHMKSSEATLAA